MMSGNKTVNILGIRGLPAAHGGFETFAGNLAPYLSSRGWAVNVYCQLDPNPDGSAQHDFEDEWNGIRRIHLATKWTASRGSIEFDWRCVKDAAKRPGVNLVLGYNTAIFCVLLRLRGKAVVMNMDGVEWRRDKWSFPIKAWFYLNELVGANIATVPIADHPEMASHLRRHWCNRARIIPYGSDELVHVEAASIEVMGLQTKRYFVSIARIEPENSILEIVRAFSRCRRETTLVVLGKLDDANAYHQAVRNVASSQVVFLGAIYEKSRVSALRVHALAYLHGHQVGGTNPSLVEALGAGNAVIAHDNRFNRWVAGKDQFYFRTESELDDILTQIEGDPTLLVQSRRSAIERHRANFTLEGVNLQYENILAKYA